MTVTHNAMHLVSFVFWCMNVYFAKRLGSLFDFGAQWPRSVLLLACPEVPSHIVSFGEVKVFFIASSFFQKSVHLLHFKTRTVDTSVVYLLST